MSAEPTGSCKKYCLTAEWSFESRFRGAYISYYETGLFGFNKKSLNLGKEPLWLLLDYCHKLLHSFSE